jgi:hypothetical protein
MSIGGVVFALVFGSAILAMSIRAVLPEHHLSSDSKDVVKLGIAVIATMSALVVSLLLASAKGSYDARSREFTEMSANLILLDRLLAHYGPETKEVRDLLRRSVVDAVDRLGSSYNFQLPILAPTTATSRSIYSYIQQLSPRDEAQRILQGQALKAAVDLSHTRWLLFEQRAGSAIQLPFLVVVVFWLCIIFASFGLYAPSNATVVATLCVCALSVAGAIFLILELDRSFEGIIRISDLPLRNALTQMGQ